MLNLSRRSLRPEWMDDPLLDNVRHLEALKGLERLNRWSLSAETFWPEINALARELNRPRLRILDIATGAGDIPLRLWQKSRNEGLRLTIEACDKSPSAIEYAQREARARNADVRFFSLDLFSQKLPEEYDVIMSSLFFHHLEEKQAADLLLSMSHSATHLILVNDLIRHSFGLALAYVGTRLLTSSPVVHNDGPQSVRAAFSLEEIKALARKAGLENFELFRRWPCRFLFVWRKKGASQ